MASHCSTSAAVAAFLKAVLTTPTKRHQLVQALVEAPALATALAQRLALATEPGGSTGPIALMLATHRSLITVVDALYQPPSVTDPTDLLSQTFTPEEPAYGLTRWWLANRLRLDGLPAERVATRLGLSTDTVKAMWTTASQLVIAAWLETFPEPPPCPPSCPHSPPILPLRRVGTDSYTLLTGTR